MDQIVIFVGGRTKDEELSLVAERFERDFSAEIHIAAIADVERTSLHAITAVIWVVPEFLAQLTDATLRSWVLRETSAGRLFWIWAAYAFPDQMRASLETSVAEMLMSGCYVIAHTFSTTDSAAYDSVRAWVERRANAATREISGPLFLGTRRHLRDRHKSGVEEGADSISTSGRDGDAALRKNLEQLSVAVRYPTSIPRLEWTTLVAYLYSASAVDAVEEDLNSAKSESTMPTGVSHGVAEFVPRGAVITVTLDIDDVEIVPQRTTFVWTRNWHRTEFQIRCIGTRDTSAVGLVCWHVGAVCIGQVFFSTLLAPTRSVPARMPQLQSVPTYKKVFVSHSHKDVGIVQALEETYVALGIQYLRDVKVLRSGERWNDAVLEQISGAGLFQLCWSTNARQSEMVEHEWRFALQSGRPRFIRPVFWEETLPEPPPELRPLHFTRLDLASLLRNLGAG